MSEESEIVHIGYSVSLEDKPDPLISLRASI